MEQFFSERALNSCSKIASLKTTGAEECDGVVYRENQELMKISKTYHVSMLQRMVVLGLNGKKLNSKATTTKELGSGHIEHSLVIGPYI